MDASPRHNRIPETFYRLGVPVSCGLFGVIITLFLNDIPHSYPSLILLGFIVLFTLAHVLWFHRVIQSLRQDLKTSVEAPAHPSVSPNITVEDKQSHDSIIEATFFQHLRNLLSITHPPHIQAQCIKDYKTHLIQINGILPLLSENQLEILVQPIVNLPQKRVAFYECIPCVTLDNGMIINLNTYSGTSKNLPSNQAIEKMILFQTLQFVRRHHVTHPNHGFVCTLSPTLYKDIHALEEFFEFLHKTHFPFHGLIFEVPLDISASQLQHLLPLKNYGVRIMGKWTDTDLPTNLTELPSPPVDFIVLPYSKLSAWLNKQPRRKGLESLSQILEITPMTIISHVEKEQDLYHRLPVTFDFAIGSAFGLTKPFYHIQS